MKVKMIKYHLSNKKNPSLTYFILNSKNFVQVLISNNKYFFCRQLESIWESITPLSMNYT